MDPATSYLDGCRESLAPVTGYRMRAVVSRKTIQQPGHLFGPILLGGTRA